MTSAGDQSDTLQDPEGRENLRRHLMGRAAQPLGAGAGSRGGDWEDPDSPGTYFGIWKKVASRSAVLGAGVGLAVALLAAIGAAAGWPLLEGAYFGAESITFTTTVAMMLLAISILALRSEEVSGPRRILGNVSAGLVVAAAVVIGLHEAFDPGLIEWAESGFFRTPAVAPAVVALLIALGLLTVDRDAPRFRWTNWLIPLIGASVVVGLLSRGFQAQVLFSIDEPRYSFSGAIGMCGLAFGFVFLRCDRGIAGFLLSTGPGPSMARLLTPVVTGIPLIMAIGQGLARSAPPQTRSLVRGLDELIVVGALVAIITYASRRLQRYFGNWRSAIDELEGQANVLDAMTEGVAMVRITDGRIVLSNPQFDHMHGYGRGELIDHVIDVLMPDDLSDDEIRRRERVGWELADRGASLYENRSLCKDGSIIWCRCNAILIEDSAHGPAMIIVKSDVTAEHRARSQGEAAELRFRQVFEQSPIGLCLVQPDGTFERVNHTFEDITGYSADELTGMTFADITHHEDLDQDLELSGAMFRGVTDSFEMEKRYVRKGGEVVWVHLNSTMLDDSQGNPTVALSMVQDVTERHELSRQLRHLAEHDPLTGLYNRRRFEQELSRTVQDGRAGGGRGVAVMIVDLDNFKFVNDNYGHTVGDRLIVRAAEVLRSRLRATDVLARQGGDEFVIMLRDIAAEDAKRMADDLVGEIAARARIEGPGFLARATASIGLAVSANVEHIDPETMIMQADIAMYEVKDSGRNGARMYNPAESSDVSRGIDWHDRIRDALDQDEFLLYAQPVVSLRGERIPRFELFVRLRDRAGTIVGPNAFLPVAERHNLVQEIDHWVTKRAIEILARAGRDTKLRLFVNLSGQSVGNLDLLRFISDELVRLNVAPESLVFEVTETSAIGNIARAQEFARSLSAIGCQMALDDFGAGFASFYYLKHIASSFVKIDGEFIRNLATDPTNRLLVKALADVTHGMGKRTVAEHVEDVEALAMLDSYGVDFVQGKLLAPPQPVSEIDLGSVPEIPQMPEPSRN
ncbi:MAG: EAL domain-containing protein [Actinomycetota bacterium]|nr:EAL domain-containing protein [Actinomycetota bacterium]